MVIIRRREQKALVLHFELLVGLYFLICWVDWLRLLLMLDPEALMAERDDNSTHE